MSHQKIPFNKPSIVGNEVEYMIDAVMKGHISGDGPYTAKCNQLLESLLGIQRVLLTTSCTHALEMSALLLNIQAGDEVIVPSFTFVTTINAFVLRGARPVFVDIRPDTLNIDERLVESRITPNTKAIILVHYAGVGCEMDTLMDIADRHGIPIIEDNAHGLFAKYRNRWLGSFGELATLSFHETKNFICGEGGALLINDPQYVERAEIIREKGTNRSKFFRGQVDKYSWVDLGSSYLPSDMLAAYLYAQLEARERITSRRKQIHEHYQQLLGDWAQSKNIRLPDVPTHCEHSHHMFYMLMPSLEKRQQFITALKQRGILSVFHYLPLHLSPMGRKWGYKEGDCPVTEDVSDRLVRLPFYYELNPELQKIVCEAIFDVTKDW